MSRLEEMQNERLRATLSTSMEQQEMAIESLTSNITNRFSRAGSALKLIASSRQREGVHSADDNVRLNIQRSLAAKLHQKSNAFRAMQKRYLGNMKELKEGSGWDSLVGKPSSGAAGAEDVDLVRRFFRPCIVFVVHFVTPRVSVALYLCLVGRCVVGLGRAFPKRKCKKWMTWSSSRKSATRRFEKLWNRSTSSLKFSRS